MNCSLVYHMQHHGHLPWTAPTSCHTYQHDGYYWRNCCQCLEPIAQTLYELMIEILWFFYYNFSYKDKIRSQFCTCHDIWAAMACAKLWHDWIIFLHIRADLFLQDLVYKPINSLWYGSLALTNSKSRWGEGLKAKWCNFKYHTKLCQILSGHFKKFSLH